MYSGTLLDIKKVIVLLHTLLAYNGLFFRYKVYSSDPRECLCTSCFLKEDCNYRNNCGIELYDGDLQHSLMKKKMDAHTFFLPFLCSYIPDLALGVLKMLIRICFRDVLPPAVY